jgi:hypothetical protein
LNVLDDFAATKQQLVERLAGLGTLARAVGADTLAGRLEELVAYVARLLAEQSGRILLENALAEGLAAAGDLGRGLDAHLRAVPLTNEQLAERIALLQRDLEGHAGTLEQRRLRVREEAAAIKTWVRRDLDRFVADALRELPPLLQQASGVDVQQHLGAFLEDAFRRWAQAETEEIAAGLARVAEQTAALMREDALEAGERIGAVLGGRLNAPAIEVDTFAYDMGVFAVLSLGLGVVFANLLLGGILLVAAPALALYTRERTEAQIRRRALEVARVALEQMAARVGPQLDQMVDEFRERLDAWVVAAGEQAHRELIEVLQRVQVERKRGGQDVQSQLEQGRRRSEQLDQIMRQLLELRGSVAARPRGVDAANQTGGQP